MNQLATITYQTLKYLEYMPCNKQNPKKIQEFLRAMEAIKLSKSEKLTLLNLYPTTPLEIQLVWFLFYKYPNSMLSKICNFRLILNGNRKKKIIHSNVDTH